MSMVPPAPRESRPMGPRMIIASRDSCPAGLEIIERTGLLPWRALEQKERNYGYHQWIPNAESKRKKERKHIEMSSTGRW